MKSSKIENLIVGASGFIGQWLWRKLESEKSHGTYLQHPLSDSLHHFSQLDIKDSALVSRLISQLSPSVVFQPAAMPYADTCEEHPKECWAINVEGTRNLAKAAKKVGAKFVYFSSDYVFDGEKGPYTEKDTPNPINVYGKAKLAAEQAIQAELDDFLVIRINGVYGWERLGKNFIMGLTQKLSNGQTMKVPIDQFGNPTYANNMVDVVLELVKENQKGIFHVAGCQHLNRHAFAVIAANIFQLESKFLLPVQTSELQQRAPRPLRAGLLSDKVKSLLGKDLLGPEEGLSRMMMEGSPFNVQKPHVS
jgi:dTDP-4-dehydrorhamnose reductase